jgi:hypothetical protein
MTDNANSENTTQFIQLQRIEIYTSTTHIQKNCNLILLSEFKEVSYEILLITEKPSWVMMEGWTENPISYKTQFWHRIYPSHITH